MSASSSAATQSYGGTSTTLVATTITALPFQEDATIVFPSPTAPQITQYTTLSPPPNPNSRYFPEVLPVLVITKAVGIVENADGEALATRTIIQTPTNSDAASPIQELVALPLPCSAWNCWSRSQQAGTAIAIVIFIIALIAVLWWGFCCKPVPKIRTQRPDEPDLENGRRKRKRQRWGWLAALLAAILAVFLIKKRKNKREKRTTARRGRSRRRRRQRRRESSTSSGSHSTSSSSPRRREPPMTLSPIRTEGQNFPRRDQAQPSHLPPSQRPSRAQNMPYGPSIRDFANTGPEEARRRQRERGYVSYGSPRGDRGTGRPLAASFGVQNGRAGRSADDAPRRRSRIRRREEAPNYSSSDDDFRRRSPDRRSRRNRRRRQEHETCVGSYQTL